MKTLYLRNVPDEVSEALEQLARRESMSVSAVAVRELRDAVAFRANADLLAAQPDRGVDLGDVVAAARSGRDR